MRIGVAGVGRMGSLHARHLAGLEPVEALVIADANPARAAEVAGSAGGSARAVGAVEELFDAGIDALVIASATDAHPALLRRAMRAGLPTLCEKPIAAGLGESIELATLERDLGARVLVGFQRRFDAGYLRARAAVAAGELGTVHSIRATTFDNAPPPPAYVMVSGGIFHDCCIHDFDTLRFVTGTEPVLVTVVGGNRGPTYIADAGDADTVAGIVTMADGTLATFNATRLNGYGHDIRFEVNGSTGDLCVGLDDRLVLTSAEPGVSFPAGSPPQGFIERFLPAYAAEMGAFVDMVACGAPSPCTAYDGLQASRMAEAAGLARRQARAVRLAEIPNLEGTPG